VKGLVKHIALITCISVLAGSCAPEAMCPGQVKAKPSRAPLTTNAKANQKKAKSSMIEVTRSPGKRKPQVIFTAKTTSKRKPPK